MKRDRETGGKREGLHNAAHEKECASVRNRREVGWTLEKNGQKPSPEKSSWVLQPLVPSLCGMPA